MFSRLIWIFLFFLDVDTFTRLWLDTLLIAVYIWFILSSMVHEVKRRRDWILLVAHTATCLLSCVPHHHLPLRLIFISHQKWLPNTPLLYVRFRSTDCFVVHQYPCLLAVHLICSFDPDCIPSKWSNSLTVVLTIVVFNTVSVSLCIVLVVHSVLDPLTLTIAVELATDHAC